MTAAVSNSSDENQQARLPLAAMSKAARWRRRPRAARTSRRKRPPGRRPSPPRPPKQGPARSAGVEPDRAPAIAAPESRRPHNVPTSAAADCSGQTWHAGRCPSCTTHRYQAGGGDRRAGRTAGTNWRLQRTRCVVRSRGGSVVSLFELRHVCDGNSTAARATSPACHACVYCRTLCPHHRVAEYANPLDLDLDTSPGWRKTGGLRAKPTPGGVPVKNMSPGESVQTCET